MGEGQEVFIFLWISCSAVSAESAALMVSEAVDIPGHSYSSEDLCSLEVQGSLHSADLSPCSTTPKGATEQSCSTLDCSTRCRFHRARSEGVPHEDDSSHSRASTDTSQGQEKNCAHSRSLDCSSENFSPSERELQRSAQESSATPPLKQKRICCADFSQPPVPSQTSPLFGPANTSSYVSGHESAVRQHHITKYRISNIVRSTSDPVSCSSYTEGRCSSTRLTELGTNERYVIYAAIGAAGNLSETFQWGLTYEWRKALVHFLDLKIFKKNGNEKSDRVKSVLAFLNCTSLSALLRKTPLE